MLKAWTCLALLFCLLLNNGSAQTCWHRTDFIWPINGSRTTPDWPQSSPFGPRLKASNSFIYDWHRGVDIPVPTGTPLLAIYDGVVTKLTGFTDPFVQLLHNRSGCESLFSYYMHLSNNSLHALGDMVKQGDVVGISGVGGYSGFPHLHFEIRKGGTKQQNCVNPWMYLPNAFDSSNHSITVSFANLTRSNVDVVVNAANPVGELDLDRVQLFFSASQGDMAGQAFCDFSFNKINFEHTPYVNGRSDLSILDSNRIVIDDVVVMIYPASYNGKDKGRTIASWEFHFKAVLYASWQYLIVRASDLAGNAKVVSAFIPDLTNTTLTTANSRATSAFSPPSSTLTTSSGTNLSEDSTTSASVVSSGMSSFCHVQRESTGACFIFLLALVRSA